MPTGARVRANNVYGITSDNPLTAAAATFNSVSLPLLPVVATAHAVIVLDPKRVHGDPEIIVVTAHTVASTVATIIRGQYGTSPRQHVVGTAWAHVPVTDDYIQITTSGSRPSDPYAGQTIFEMDTDRYLSRDAANANWVRTDWTTASGRTGVRLRRVANQSIPNNGGSPTAIIWDVEDFDSDGFFVPSSSSITVPAGLGGIYAITAKIDLQSAAIFGGRSFVDLQAGAITWRCPIVPGFDGLTVASITIQLAAADVLSIALFQTSGGAVNIGPVTRVEMYRIGA